MTLLAATNKQVPDNSILDLNGKQTYLGNQYSASQNFTIGSSETALILIQNIQTGSFVNMKSLFQNMIKVSANTAAKTVQINVYLNPTITGNGSTLTPVNLRSSYGNNSIATVTYSPTISGNGTLIDVISADALSVSQSNLLKILDEGQSLLITGAGSTSSTALNVVAQWYEL